MGTIADSTKHSGGEKPVATKSFTEARNKRWKKLKKERRIMRVVVDLDLVGDMFVAGTRRSYKVEGIPEDAIFIGAQQSIEYYGVNFFYLHESFEPVQEGLIVPQASVTITAFNDLKPSDSKRSSESSKSPKSGSPISRKGQT